MKLRVVVDDRTFEVEVGSLSERPVVAVVDGERFEVWPEGQVAAPPTAASQASGGLTARQGTGMSPQPTPRPSRLTSERGMAPPAQASRTVYAPIPGVIYSIAVTPGDTVVAGQELCVLEAMKMKNVIRAPSAGEIGSVRVAPGQHVKHHDVLMDYVD